MAKTNRNVVPEATKDPAGIISLHELVARTPDGWGTCPMIIASGSTIDAAYFIRRVAFQESVDGSRALVLFASDISMFK